MKVEWSAFALEDRDRIFDYIESESPKAAVLVDSRIEEQVNQLARFPELGRPGRVDDTRNWSSARHRISHRICVYGDVVRILRVLHHAQLWPDMLGG